jgi:hypothetical protein
MPHPGTQPETQPETRQETQPETHPDHAVPHHVVAAYARDEVVLVRGLLDADEVALAARAVDRVLAEPSPLALVASAPDDPGRFTEDFCRWGPGSCPGPS